MHPTRRTASIVATLQIAAGLSCLLGAGCSVQEYWPQEQAREFELELRYPARRAPYAIELPSSDQDLTVLELRWAPARIREDFATGRRRLRHPGGDLDVQLQGRIRVFRRRGTDGNWPAWPDPLSFFPGAEPQPEQDPPHRP